MDKNKWLLTFENEYKQLIGGWNWYSFTFINIYFENDRWTHGYEFIFMVLGLGFRFRYNTDKALELFDKWDKEIQHELQISRGKDN